MLFEPERRVLFSFARERCQIGRASQRQRPFGSFRGFSQKEHKQSMIARSTKEKNVLSSEGRVKFIRIMPSLSKRLM